MTVFIRNIDGDALYESDADTIREAAEEAVHGVPAANLRFADLRGADLSRTVLRGADLELADLRGAEL